MMMTDRYSVRPQLKDEFRIRRRLSNQIGTTAAAASVKYQKRAEPPPDKHGGGRVSGPLSRVAFNSDADDGVVVKKEFKASWLKIPKSAVQEINRKPNKKKSRRLLDTIDGREKVEWLKQTRDYSFLSSPDDNNWENIIAHEVVAKCDKQMNMMKDKGSKKIQFLSKNSKKAVPLEEEEIILPTRIKKPLSPKPDHGKKRKTIFPAESSDKDDEVNTKKTRMLIKINIHQGVTLLY